VISVEPTALDVVPDVLAECTGGVEEAGPRRWNFLLDAAANLEGTAWLTPDWLCLELRLAGLKPRLPVFPLLERHAGLPGNVKFVLVPGERFVRVRAEIPVEGELDITPRIRDACLGFCGAALLLTGRRNAAEFLARHEPTPPAAPAPVGLESLCRDAGFPCTPRSAACVTVEFEAPGQYWQALLESDGHGVRARVELLSGQALSPAYRKALGLFLLTVNGAVRMARAVAARRDGRAGAHLEVCFGAPPTAAEIRHALAAVCAAARLCARESRVLQDQAIAREYLLRREGGLAGRTRGSVQ
jgi:hypothetical protein